MELSSVRSDPGFAAIDVGSHTIRLLAARLENDHDMRPLRLERRITRLARDFQQDDTLRQESIRAGIEVLKEYASLVEHLGVNRVSCGATGVVRKARNRDVFLDSAKKETGLDISVLSEQEEALHSARGILSVLKPPPERILLSFDLGGSSTEFILVDTERPEPLFVTSVFVGAATLTQSHFDLEPPPALSLKSAEDDVRKSLESTFAVLKSIRKESTHADRPLLVVGTAGTVTTLAALFLRMSEYEPNRINGLVLHEPWLSETIHALAALPVAARRGLPGLEAGREDIILGGALIVREILRGLGTDRLTVSDGGLLEGLLIDLIEKSLGRPRRLVTPLTWRFQ